MRIRSFAHKSLKRFYSEDSAKGVPPGTVDKLRKMFAFLDTIQRTGAGAALKRTGTDARAGLRCSRVP